MVAISVRVIPRERQTYRPSELGAALVSDGLFFLRRRDRWHRARNATPAEIRCVQAVEGRLLEPSPGYEAIVLVQRVAEGRRRVVIEAMGLDCDAMDEADLASLFQQVT